MNCEFIHSLAELVGWVCLGERREERGEERREEEEGEERRLKVYNGKKSKTWDLQKRICIYFIKRERK